MPGSHSITILPYRVGLRSISRPGWCLLWSSGIWCSLEALYHWELLYKKCKSTASGGMLLRWRQMSLERSCSLACMSLVLVSWFL